MWKENFQDGNDNNEIYNSMSTLAEMYQKESEFSEFFFRYAKI